jgi:hypothetical protein
MKPKIFFVCSNRELEILKIEKNQLSKLAYGFQKNEESIT